MWRRSDERPERRVRIGARPSLTPCVFTYLFPMTLGKDGPSLLKCDFLPGMDSYREPFAHQNLVLYCLGTMASLHSFQIQIPKAFLSFHADKPPTIAERY